MSGGIWGWFKERQVCQLLYTKTGSPDFHTLFRKQTFLGKNNKKCVKNSQG